MLNLKKLMKIKSFMYQNRRLIKYIFDYHLFLIYKLNVNRFINHKDLYDIYFNNSKLKILIQIQRTWAPKFVIISEIYRVL